MLRIVLLLLCWCAFAETTAAAATLAGGKKKSMASYSAAKPVLHRPNYTIYKPGRHHNGLSRLLHVGKH